MKQYPLAPIAGGLSEGTVEGRQPKGTYSDGANVRGIDPRTGRLCWGAQRAGLEGVGDAPNQSATPTHLFQAERVIPRERWVDLTTTPADDTTPSSVSVEWSTNLQGGPVLDVQTSLEGVGYFLLETGEVVLVNAAGRATERIPSQTPTGFRTVPRLGVDTEGGVYLAATRDEGDEQTAGVAARLVRLTKNDADVWEVQWEAFFEHRVIAFAYGDGHLYVVEDPVEPESGDRPPAALTRMSAPLSTGLFAWRQVPLPRPIFDVAIGRGGSALISCPASPLRFAVDGTLFSERSVTWTPHNLPSGAASLYAWVSADYVNDSETEPDDGDAVTVMMDRRKKANPYVEIGGPTRDMRKPVHQLFQAPTWDEEAFGGLGGLLFTPQSVLRSGRNTSVDVEDSLALLPPLENYALVMAIQLDEAAVAAANTRKFWSQRSTLAGQPDLAGVLFGSVTSVTDQNAAISTTPTDIATAADDGVNGSLCAIITFFPSVGGAAPAFRVNGFAAAAGAAFPDVVNFGPYQTAYVSGPSGVGPFVAGPCTTFGEGDPNEVNLLSDPLVALTLEGAHPFDEPRRIVDESFASYLNLTAQTSPTVTPRVVVDFGSSWIGMDSIRVATNAVHLLVEFDDTSSAFGALVASAEYDLEQFPSVDVGNGMRVYDLRIGNATDIAAQYARFTFTPRSGTQTVRLAELSLRAQSLNAISNLLSDTWKLYEAVVLDTSSIGNIQLVEGYLARKIGILHEFPPTTGPNAHPYGSDGSMPPVTGELEDVGLVRQTMRSRYPLLVKYGSDGTPLAAVASAGVGLGAVADGDNVLTWGEPDPYGGGAPNSGTIGRKLVDLGRTFTGTGGWNITAGTEIPLVSPTRLATGPCGSLFVPFRPAIGSTGAAAVRRYRGVTVGVGPGETGGDLRWSLAQPLLPIAVASGGLMIDESAIGGACGPEFLFVGTVGEARSRRVAVTGRFDSGEPESVEISTFRIDTLGDIRRFNSTTDAWDSIEASALAGERPWSATLYGFTIIGDGRRYRVYDAANRTLRDFAAAVKGYLPPRAKLGLAHRGRCYLAAADNPYALYANRYGEVFDWDLGPIFEDAAQAVAGTTSSQGKVPERITALMPLSDDVLLIGTSRKQYALTGDLGEGGRLDEVDRSNGVAFGYAWCVGSNGLYYFSANGGLWRRTNQGAQLLSAGKVQRRFEDIDQRRNRIELAYRWQDRTVHIFVIPLGRFEADIRHYVYEEPTEAFHIDVFGGGVLRQVTAVATLDGGSASERTLMLGFADNEIRRFSSSADDDDGVVISSHALVGPLLPQEEMREGVVQAVYGQLASDGGGVEVAVRASETADVPGPVVAVDTLQPGRGYGATVPGAGAALFIEVRGLGRHWCAHEMSVEGAVAGEKRSNR